MERRLVQRPVVVFERPYLDRIWHSMLQLWLTAAPRRLLVRFALIEKAYKLSMDNQLGSIGDNDNINNHRQQDFVQYLSFVSLRLADWQRTGS